MIKYIILNILLATSLIFSQSKITGKVVDNSGRPLIGANIMIVGTNTGTATDNSGKFELSQVKLPVTLRVSMVGYKTVERYIDSEKQIVNIKIMLYSSEIETEQVIVSASKYKQKITDLPVSAEVMDAEFISEKNITQLDEALRYVPGVNITLDQISIRGSSGYSRGAGTRVLTAIEGIPIYSGDTGEIIWQIVPVDDIDKIEVIKGAASSLYGSTALGGVVNVVTKETSSSPVTLVRTYGGFYDKPYYSEWDWSDNIRTFNGLTISHSNSFKNVGFSSSFSRIENDSYRQGDWSKRYAGYLKSKIKFSPKSSLTLLGMGISQRRGTFNFWKDSRNALVPPDADQGQIVSSTRVIGGVVFDQEVTSNWKMKVITSYYYNYWKDESESANNSTSSLLRTEVQSENNIGKSTRLISGIELTRGVVQSNIFGNPTSFSLGGYFQSEIKLLEQLKLFGGARYDITKLDTLDSFKDFSPKFGLNYKLSDDIILRASFGMGFRAPSLAEAFTSTNTSGISVKPNPNLLPESSNSIELGGKKVFGKFAELDIALFNNDYFDMIEPKIDTDGKVVFENVTRARIQGGELSGKIFIRELDTYLNVGYTFLSTKDLNLNKSLKYRPKHLLYSSLQYSPHPYRIGIDFRYWSRVEEIDNELVDLGLVKDGERRSEVFVVDLRFGVSMFQFNFPANIYFNVNNVFNYNYVEMIGNVSPIRNISLNLELLF